MVQSKGTEKDITEMWDGDGKKKKSTERQGQFVRQVKSCICLELENVIDFQNRFMQVKRFIPSSLSSKSVM